MAAIENPTTDCRLSNRRLLGESVAVGLLVLACLFPVIKQLALGWDEGFTFERQELLEEWLGQVYRSGSKDRIHLFSKPALDRYWRFSREEPDGHGPFYCLLSLLGRRASEWMLEPPASYRFGSLALFAAAAASVYAVLRPRIGALAALVAVALLGSTPRAIPEVCFALIDGPLLSLALLAWCGFVWGVESDSRIGRVLFGIAVGLAMANKLTGWFFPLPYLISVAWIQLRSAVSPGSETRAEREQAPSAGSETRAKQEQKQFRRRPAWKTLAVGAVVALATVFAVNVGWWPDPVGGVRLYFESNLTRGKTIPIANWFWGERYPFSLPWYNTLVWTVIAMPISTVVLGTVGIIWSVAGGRRRSWCLLLVLNWMLLMVLRALPNAPGHDGTRQIIVSFGFLAILAGIGFHAIACLFRGEGANAARSSAGSSDPAQSQLPIWRRIAPYLLAAIIIGESVGSGWRYHPLQLSYYSPLVGGIAGAEKLGFEPTYFWDAVTPEVLDWLNANTSDGRCVLFANHHPGWRYLARWGKLRAAPCDELGKVPYAQWFVMQHRTGILTDQNRRLLEQGPPAYQKCRFGVPLISIFSMEQWNQAQRSIGNSKSQIPRNPKSQIPNAKQTQIPNSE